MDPVSWFIFYRSVLFSNAKVSAGRGFKARCRGFVFRWEFWTPTKLQIYVSRHVFVSGVYIESETRLAPASWVEPETDCIDTGLLRPRRDWSSKCWKLWKFKAANVIFRSINFTTYHFNNGAYKRWRETWNQATSNLCAANWIAYGVPEDMVELRVGYLRTWSDCVRGTWGHGRIAWAPT